ncbi:hypothetical protein ACISU4_09205, partial [Streptomyces wuyuanensis]|uniref:hypothetical protein n=1 Tax=Streptomyces wuyuanensis TaxID=1196353 RepID=UPI00382FAB40
ARGSSRVRSRTHPERLGRGTRKPAAALPRPAGTPGAGPVVTGRPDPVAIEFGEEVAVVCGAWHVPALTARSRPSATHGPRTKG